MSTSQVKMSLDHFIRNGSITTHQPKLASTTTSAIAGAYVLRHVETGLCYAGSSGNVGYRVWKHFHWLSKKTHQNHRMQELHNHSDKWSVFHMLTETREEALDLEQEILDRYHPTNLLINIAKNARLATLGARVSDEAREATRARFKGKKLNPEHVEKIRLGNLGKKRTPEQNARSSIARLGKKLPPGTGEKTAIKLRGIPRNLEVREKIRLGHLHRSKRVRIDGVEYESVMAASRALQVDRNLIKYRISRGKEGWSYV